MYFLLLFKLFSSWLYFSKKNYPPLFLNVEHSFFSSTKYILCKKRAKAKLVESVGVATLIADKRPKDELIEKIEKHDVNETKYVAEEKDYVEEAESRPQHAPNKQLCHEITEEFVRIDKKNQSEGEPATVGAPALPQAGQQCARRAAKLKIFTHLYKNSNIRKAPFYTFIILLYSGKKFFRFTLSLT